MTGSALPHTALPHPSLQPLPLPDVTITDTFWSARRETVRTSTLPTQLHHLKTHGQLEALRLQWRAGDPDEPHIFWDSDVAKWIEAASYSLAAHPDPELEAEVDAAISLLAGAQQPDGYLNTYFSVVAPGQRFTDLRDAHELYCAGHLIEAGVAHFESTGRKSLLDVVRRYADLIADVFGPGPGQIRGYDGHEEIELALVRLARVTGERRYLELATFFVDERGREPYFFDLEAEQRGTPGYFAGEFTDRDDEPRRYREYLQAHAPVREQTEAVGHSVRAMYLYSAMADLAAENSDQTLLDACRTLWEHLTGTRMYLTGGIGSSATNEGFTADHDLPDLDAYAETCAAIGLVFWSSRMARLDRDSRYGDVLERALYNGVLSGVSADGTHFFYDNPLASRGDKHRSAWFGVACCPPNLARLLTSLGSYAYAASPDELSVELYLAGTATAVLGGAAVTLQQQAELPWNGAVRLEVQLADQQQADFTLALRIPAWAGRGGRAPSLRVAGETVELAAVAERGYARLTRTWRSGDVVELELPTAPERVWAHPAVESAAGKVALTRGPLVYCFEATDHDAPLHTLALDREAALTDADDVVDGLVALTTTGSADEAGGDDRLYRDQPPARREHPLTAVPYYSWDNREPGAMTVWLREDR